MFNSGFLDLRISVIQCSGLMLKALSDNLKNSTATLASTDLEICLISRKVIHSAIQWGAGLWHSNLCINWFNLHVKWSYALVPIMVSSWGHIPTPLQCTSGSRTVCLSFHLENIFFIRVRISFPHELFDTEFYGGKVKIYSFCFTADFCGQECLLLPCIIVTAECLEILFLAVVIPT